MTAWNEQIRQLRLRRRLTQEQLAEQLARVAWERDKEHVGVDGGMVSKWERGQKQPSNSYRRLLAEFFDTDELDFIDPAANLDDLGLEYARSLPETIDAIDNLGHADMDRRTFLKSAVFAVAASVGPSRDWLLATLEKTTSAAHGVSSTQVEAIRRAFGVFQTRRDERRWPCPPATGRVSDVHCYAPTSLQRPFHRNRPRALRSWRGTALPHRLDGV